MARRSRISANGSAYRTVMRSWSTTGNAKPARWRSAPAARTSTKGATRGEAPPVSSDSAKAKDSASSRSVSPPSMAARNRPSGLRARRIWVKTPGRSLTSCSDSADTTRSRLSEAKGSTSSSPTTRLSSAAARFCRRRQPDDAFGPPALRTASARNAVGVPMSAATSKCRCTVASRSSMSSATWRSRKSEAPAFTARRAGESKDLAVEDDGRAVHGRYMGP